MKFFLTVSFIALMSNIYAQQIDSVKKTTKMVWLCGFTGAVQVPLYLKNSPITSKDVGIKFAKLVRQVWDDERLDPNRIRIEEKFNDNIYAYRYAAGSITTDDQGNNPRVLYYDPKTLTDEIFTKGNGVAILVIVMHELGHFCNNDNYMPNTDSIELKADNYSACHIAKTYENVKLPDMLTAIELTSENPGKGYPTRQQRINAITDGFKKGKAHKVYSPMYTMAHVKEIQGNYQLFGVANKYTAAIASVKIDPQVYSNLSGFTETYVSYNSDLSTLAYSILPKKDLTAEDLVKSEKMFIRKSQKDASITLEKDFSTDDIKGNLEKFNDLIDFKSEPVYELAVNYLKDTVQNQTFENSSDYVYSVNLKSGVNGLILANHGMYYLGKTGRKKLGDIKPSMVTGYKWVIVDEYYDCWYINDKNELYYLDKNNSSYIGSLILSSNFIFK